MGYLTHHAVVYEWSDERSPYLTDEHFLLWDLHVESKLVVGDKVQVLLKDLPAIDHATQDSKGPPGEKGTGDNFR